MFKTDSLPAKTRILFEFLSGVDLMRDYTLIGGTAMSLQLGHRCSEDLDFWVGADMLNKRSLSMIVRTAQDQGFDAQLVTPNSQIGADRPSPAGQE